MSRTVTKWMRFLLDDSSGTPREIPVDSVSPVGFAYDETDLTAYQDAVKGYLTAHPDAVIEVTVDRKQAFIEPFNMLKDLSADPLTSQVEPVFFDLEPRARLVTQSRVWARAMVRQAAAGRLPAFQRCCP